MKRPKVQSQPHINEVAARKIYPKLTWPISTKRAALQENQEACFGEYV